MSLTLLSILISACDGGTKNNITNKDIESTSVKVNNSRTSEQDTSSSSNFERLNCKDPKVIAEFVDTMNNSPSALSNNIKIVDVDADYIEEISFTENPYELQCGVKFTLNDSSEVNFIMKIYDKNGKGKMMIEGTPSEIQSE